VEDQLVEQAAAAFDAGAVSPGPSAGGQGAACQDRATERGERFLSGTLGKAGNAERQAMIDKPHALP